MSTFTKESAVSTAVKRFNEPGSRQQDMFNASTAWSFIESLELSQDHYIALTASLIEGEWGMGTVTAALINVHKELDVMDLFLSIEQDLVDHRVLVRTNDGRVFSSAFITAASQTYSKFIDTLPAKMTPFTEPVGDWTSLIHEDLNLPFVKANTMQNYSALANMPQVTATINRMQQTAYRVNVGMLNALNGLAKYHGKESELQQVKFEIFKHMANQLVGDDLYFALTLDYRGRIYYRGGIMTPQGDDMNKALFEFSTATPLGDTGYDALCIHFANVAGYDKLSTYGKIEWAKGAGRKIANRMYDKQTFDLSLDKPYQAFVAGCELMRINILMKKQDVRTITSRVVCHTDGTCNGLQHGAALLGHKATAKSVNCLESAPSDLPSDVYKDGALALADKLGSTKFPILVEALRSALGRTLLKDGVMITGYGAGLETVLDNFYEIVDGKVDGAYDEMSDNDNLLESAMESSLEQVAGGMIHLTAELKQVFADSFEELITWTTPDGFVVNMAKTEVGEILFPGTPYERVIERKTDAQSNKSSLSPNFVHSLDATHLRMTVANCEFDVVTVHDSFGCTPGNYMELNKVLREQFVELHSHDLLTELCESNGLEHTFAKGNYDVSDVMKSEYFFS